jgi:uncharacterized protein
MIQRRHFLKTTGLVGAGFLLQPKGLFAFGNNDFETNRPPLSKRHFTSQAVEDTIAQMKKKLPNKELGWLFENCFPNTLDTTVYHEVVNGKPDTYVITGDIDAMWMRDSTAQVWPYLPLMKQDKKLQQLIAGVINRQTKYIHKDPYANAFYKDENKISEWKDDLTDMKPGVHERKWEIDSLCYPIRLSYNYWKLTDDITPFDAAWQESIALIVKTFKEQQRKKDRGPYSFQRNTPKATDTVPLLGFGYPENPVGLISSSFRPSDDATLFSFLIPSNFFAVTSLRQVAEMLKAIHKNNSLADECTQLANEVNAAIAKYGIANHPKFGKVYAYETDGFGNHLFMDDANVPSLLALPYLGCISSNDKLYLNTRRMVLSDSNPFYFKGKAAEGIGGPHVAVDMVWPLGIILRGLTSNNDPEIKQCINTLLKTHAGKGFMHESFNKDDASKYTRDWFAWANTIFGEFILHVEATKPYLLR